MKTRKLLVMLALALGACGGGDASERAEEKEYRVKVSVVPLEVGEVRRTLALTGTVEAGKAADLVPTGMGRIESVVARVGSRVDKGDILVKLDADVARLQAEQAEAAVRLAELNLQTATRESGRAETLHASGTLTDQQLEQALLARSMAEAQLDQARAARGLAREQVEGAVLRAPFAGTVTAVNAEPGELFTGMALSAMGAPTGMVSVVDLATIRVDLQAAEREVARIQPGMEARIFVDALDGLLPADGLGGEVLYVGQAADPASRTFPVRVVAENPGQVVPAGTHARVLLVMDRAPDVLRLPTAAIRGTADDRFVMTVEEGVARRAAVTPVFEGDGYVAVTSDLPEGAPVVADGSFGLADGTLVEIVP